MTLRRAIDKARRRLGGDRHLAELLRGSATAFALKMVGRGIASVFALIVARVLGAEAWGGFALALAFISMGSLFSLAGTDTAIMRLTANLRAGGRPEAVRPLYWRVLTFVVPCSVVVAFLAFHFGHYVAEHFFRKPELSPLFRLAALAIIPMSVANLTSYSLRGMKRIKDSIMIQQVSRMALPLLIFAGAVFVWTGSEAVMYAFVIGTWLVAAQGVYYMVRATERPLSPVELPAMGAILRLALPMLLAGSMQFLKGWIDTIMVGAFLPTQQVGIYDVAFKLATLTSVSLWAVNSISAPKIAELHGAGDVRGMERVVQHASRLIMITSVPVLALFILVPGFFMGLFGAEFRAGALTLSIISMGYFVHAFFGVVGSFLVMTGKQVAYQNIVTASALLSVGLNYVLIPVFGIEGAAISTAVSLTLFNVGCAWVIKRDFGISTFFNPFRRSAAPASPAA